MPDFDINLVFKDGQAIGKIRQVRSELQKTERQANRTRGAFRGLFAGISTAVAVREFINLSNSAVAIENRLKIVEDAVGDTETAFQRLRDISRATRSPLEENTALFQRAAQAQAELGATTEELFQFVEATGTALAIQGGAANTARGALIQLSQAIGATVVRAEEFNSILEGALPLAQAAARGIDEAGGSVSRLRQLVISGQITSEEFFRAIVSQQEFLQEQFARTNPTIAQSFVVLRNEAIAAFRTFDEATNITTRLAQAILFLADNIGTVARILAGAGIFFAITRGATLALAAVNALRAGLVTLAIAAFANPITAAFAAIGVAIAAVISLVASFGDQIQILGGQATLIDLLAVAWERVRNVILAVGQFLADTFLPQWNLTFDTIGDLITGFLRFWATAFDFVIAVGAGSLAALRVAWDNFWIGVRNLTIDTLTFIAQQFEDLVNGFVTVLNFFRDEPIEAFTQTTDALKALSREEGASAGQAFNNAFANNLASGPALTALTNFFNDVRERASLNAPVQGPNLPPPPPPSTNLPSLGGGGGGSQATFADIVEEYEKGIEALGRLGREQRIYNEILRASDRIGRDLTQTEQDQIAALVEKTEVLQRASDIYDNINGRVDDFITTQAALNNLLERGAISQTEADFALSQSDLVQDLRDVENSLGGQFDFSAQRQAITDFVNERTIILQQAREQDLLNEEEYQARLRALTAASQREILNLELDRWQLAVDSANNSIGILLNAAEEYAGKQSGIYKGLFLAQKAFAIAEATINTFRAISNALAAPFPPPIPQTLAAAAAVAGGAQVAAIVGSTISGLRDGGRVSGPGGPRDDAAGLFALSNGEFVVNAAATAANLPLLEAINRGMKPLGAMQNGGLVNTGSQGLRNAGSGELQSAARSAPAALPDLKNDVSVPVTVVAVADENAALNAVESGQLDNAILVRLGENSPAVRNTIGLEN